MVCGWNYICVSFGLSFSSSGSCKVLSVIPGNQERLERCDTVMNGLHVSHCVDVCMWGGSSPLDSFRMSSRRRVIPRSSGSSSSLLSTRLLITSLMRSRDANRFSAEPNAEPSQC